MSMITVALALLAASPGPQPLNETQKLVPADAQANTSFGREAAIHGDVAVLGAKDKGIASASVYRNIAGTWTEEATLFSGGDPRHQGDAVATDGQRIVVGAPSARGTALVYLFDGQAWNLEAQLEPDDPNAAHFFGSAVAIASNTIIVGASAFNTDFAGSAYVFHFDGTNWTQQAKILASDPQPRARFGAAVAVDDGVAVVGAYNQDNTDLSFPDGIGSAYLYERTGNTWNQVCRLSPFNNNAGERDAFGYSLAIDRDTIIVGSNPITIENMVAPTGAAYIFRHVRGDGCIPDTRLVANTAQPGDRFASAVDISNDLVVMGAWGTAIGQCPFPMTCDDGTAYAFRFDGSSWTEQATLKSSDLDEGDLLGWAVAVDADTAIIGAWRNDDNGFDTGSAYVFDLAIDCPADIDGDGDADSQDFFAYLDLFAQGDDRADITGNGVIDSDDFFAYLNLFVLGC